MVPLGTTRGEESLIGARIARPLHAVLRAPAIEVPPQRVDPQPRPAETASSAPAPAAAVAEASAAVAAIAPVKPAPEMPPSTSEPAPRTGESTAGIVPLPDDYLDARELSELPRPLADPRLAEIERIVSRAGEIRMVLFIDESGKVVAIDVRSSTLPGDAVASAVSIFSEVPFSPGRVGGAAVKSRIRITVGAARRSNSYGN